jgi:hypothetical protein
MLLQTTDLKQPINPFQEAQSAGCNACHQLSCGHSTARTAFKAIQHLRSHPNEHTWNTQTPTASCNHTAPFVDIIVVPTCSSQSTRFKRYSAAPGATPATNSAAARALTTRCRAAQQQQQRLQKHTWNTHAPTTSCNHTHIFATSNH